MTGIPLCEEESENYSLLNRKQGGQPTRTHMHKSRDMQADTESVCPDAQECVHRHANRNIVHKAIHTQTPVCKQIHSMLYTYVHRGLHVLQNFKAQSQTHHETSAYQGPLALPLDLTSPLPSQPRHKLRGIPTCFIRCC